MAAFQSFVSEDYLKSTLPISKNLDISEVLPFLEDAELLNIREIIGKPLYDDIKSKYIAQTLSDDEIIMVSLIKKAITWRASEQSLPFLNVKIKAKGPVKMKGEWEEAASLSDVKYLREELRNKADYYEERLLEYICRNSSKFPLYSSSDTETNIIPQQETRFDSDIFFDDDYELRSNRYIYGKNNPK